MRTTTITAAKNGFSGLIDQVKAGESIVILDRGRPVAVIEPATLLADPTGRLERLERAGIVRRASVAMPLDLLRQSPPPVVSGDAVKALLDERGETR